MEVSELGEFPLIDRLKRLAGDPPEGEVWAGDDAAVLRAPGGTILFTSDLLIEGVHFNLELTGPEDLGYKAIAVNISDVAAMGGIPRRALVSLGLRPQIEVEWIEKIYSGMRECCDEFGAAVAGGDLSRSDCLIISVALLGNPAGRRVIERSGARPGDVIAVTGTLGAAGAGYRMLRAGMKEPAAFLQAHLRPKPRVREVEVLRGFLPSAMIDVSDGFAADLGHICEASSVGVVVESSALPKVDLTDLGIDRGALQLALGGGEDYELCFTIAAERFEDAASAVLEKTGTTVTRVGDVVEAERGRILLIEGDEEPLEAPGWDHLRV